MAEEHRQRILAMAVQNHVDGIVAGDVLYLATAKVVFRGQCMDLLFAEVGDHRVPDVGTGFFGGLLELDLIEEAALKGRVEILRQVGGCNHNAVELLHLLQDDVLDGVLHLVHRTLCSLLADTDNGIGFVEE